MFHYTTLQQQRQTLIPCLCFQVNQYICNGLALRGIICECISCCDGKLTSSNSAWSLPPFVIIVIRYVVDDGSTGITQSSNPLSLDALVRESLMRIYAGSYLSLTTAPCAIGGSSSWRTIFTISPQAPLVMSRSVSTFSVTNDTDWSTFDFPVPPSPWMIICITQY